MKRDGDILVLYIRIKRHPESIILIGVSKRENFVRNPCGNSSDRAQNADGKGHKGAGS